MSSIISTTTLRAEPEAASGLRASSRLRVAGLLLFVLASGFLTVTMLGASIAPDYDYAGGAISDLGVVSETALLFNATLIGVGLLNAMGGYLFYRAHGQAWVLAMFVLGGIGAIGAGVFPLDSGQAHSLFALAGFTFFNLQAIAAATVISGPMRVVSVLAGALGLLFVVVMIIGDSGSPAIFGPIGHGGAERMIVFPAMLWLVGFGGYLMAAASDGHRGR